KAVLAARPRINAPFVQSPPLLNVIARLTGRSSTPGRWLLDCPVEPGNDTNWSGRGRRPESPREGLGDVGDEIVGVLDPARHADQGRRDPDLALRLPAQPGMHRRRRMTDQRFGAAEAHGELEHLEPVEKGERLRLAAFDLEGERRAWRARLPFHQ